MDDSPRKSRLPAPSCRFAPDPSFFASLSKLPSFLHDNLVITSWCMGRGCPHVALSRVQTLKGIFLRLPLKEIKNPGLAIDVGTVILPCIIGKRRHKKLVVS